MAVIATERWTKEQTIIAFNLYCKIPFNRVSSTHPEVKRIAKLIGRSANSVKMKIGNFGSFDPELKKRGIVGLANTSKLDQEVWNEFNRDWEKLAFESELLIAKFDDQTIEETLPPIDFDFPKGRERESLVKTRVNQQFFRNVILSSYNSTCCITGINISSLLVASHIKPWSADAENRLNPRNGLCLNSLHHMAYDNGLITITTDFEIKVSKQVGKSIENETTKNFFHDFDGNKIKLPQRFIPDHSFLEFHEKNIFQL